jgi:hypothetical protein
MVPVSRLAFGAGARACYDGHYGKCLGQIRHRPEGQERAVQLGLGEYRRLIRRLEDLEDAVALDCAEETCKGLLPYIAVRKRLKGAG